ncbi:MAG: HlyD family efflux transporter periplasmic adaptor subunit [Chloroflexi bacterium CFX6]|nr:HlyD family efflux transporter periplasmic adaptor subunit [Chloroflexi bacterium CFX6]
MAAAQAKARQLESGSALAQARIEVERAKNTLWGNQAQRDAACGRADNGNLPGSVRDEARTSCDAAQASVQASEQGVALAELNVKQAEDSAGDDLTAARAQLESARLSLRQAEANLAKATLTAPFTGTVTSIQPLVGDAVSPGAPVLTLTRTRPLRFVTTNLGERFVGDIRVGDAAEVTLTAYPDHVITGKVARIDDLGKLDESGAVVFAVHVDVDETADATLRAGMTGRVEITVGGDGA